MPTVTDLAEREPGELDVGNREDWEIIEAALGFKDFDTQRRKLLCGRLQNMVSLYYGWGPPESVHEPQTQVDKVRPAHFKSALGVLRNHATRLRCYLGAEPREPWPTDELGELEGWALWVFLRDHYLMVSKRNRSALTNRLKELIGLIDNALQSLPRIRADGHATSSFMQSSITWPICTGSTRAGGLELHASRTSVNIAVHFCGSLRLY
jgi:hypothetical protein